MTSCNLSPVCKPGTEQKASEESVKLKLSHPDGSVIAAVTSWREVLVGTSSRLHTRPPLCLQSSASWAVSSLAITYKAGFAC